MKILGAIRKIDQLGRVCIPVEYRRYLNIEDEEKAEIKYIDDKIIIDKVSNAGNIKGITRPLDPLGRITLPAAYRRLLQIKEHDDLDIMCTNGRIEIKKYQKTNILALTYISDDTKKTEYFVTMQDLCYFITDKKPLTVDLEVVESE